MNIQRRCGWILCLLSMLFLLSACGNQEAELADDIFLKVTSTAKGEGVETYEMYTLNLEIHQDGTVRCYADDFNRWLSTEECPEDTIKLTQEQIVQIQAYMDEVDLYHMRENIGNRDLKEGEYKSLTVYTTDGEHTSGGLNPSNQEFLKVYDYVENLTREMTYSYRAKIRDLQKKGLAYQQAKGITITDAQENEIVTTDSINDVYVTFGDAHERYEQTMTDAERKSDLYYVTIKLSDDMAEQMELDTAGCTPDLPEYYKLYENETYTLTFGIQQQIKNGELYVYETTDAAEAKSMAEQFRNSVYD